MRFKFFTAMLLLNCYISVFSIELEYVKKKVQILIPIGNDNGSLRYLDSDPYEPEAPTQVQISKTGNIYIVDFHQGIVEYGSNFKYIKTYKAIGCDRVTLADDFFVAWDSTSSNPTMTFFDYNGNIIGSTTRLGGRCELISKGNFIFYHLFKGKAYGIKISEVDITKIKDEEIESVLLNNSIFIKDKYFFNDKIGIITSSGETFFRINNAPEVQYAQLKNGNDRINISRNKIFAVDDKNRRYLFYFGEKEARISIADENGKLLKVMKPITNNEKISIPCLMNNGDIGFISSTSNGHELCIITKTW